jgi:hypothetical protein
MNSARISIVISFFIIIASQGWQSATAQSDSHKNGDTSRPTETPQSQISTETKLLSEPLISERKQIRELISRVRAKGFDVKSYEDALKQIEGSIHSGKPDDSLQGFAAGLIRNLDEQLNRKPPVVIAGPPTTGSSPRSKQAKIPHSRKSSAEQYSDELRKCQQKQVKEHKKAMSKDFWQKFHDKFHKPKQIR